jgi:hypothetical protein
MTPVVEASRNSSREPIVQKKCSSCNHPFSFHGNGRTGCRAMGCKCATWTEEDPWTEKEHYAAVVSMLRAMEVSSRLVTQGERSLLYVGGYIETSPEDLPEVPEGYMAVPGEWKPPFAVWANHGGAWGYSVLDERGEMVDTGSDVMPHDTDAETVARIVATWTYPPEETP